MSYRRALMVFLMVAGPPFAVASVWGAEPTETMRTMARMTVILEAHDLKGYCTEMHTAPYAGYLTRVCQSAVQNRLTQPEDCTPEKIAQQVKVDNEQCLAMPPAEFEKKMLDGRKVKETLIKQMQEQGIDGEKLLQEERAKRREQKPEQLMER